METDNKNGMSNSLKRLFVVLISIVLSCAFYFTLAPTYYSEIWLPPILVTWVIALLLIKNIKIINIEFIRKNLLLIVVLLVIIVVAVVGYYFTKLKNPQEERGLINDYLRQSHLKRIENALVMYHADNGKYPNSLQDLKGNLPTAKYLTDLPKDPVTNQEYVYNLFDNSKRKEKNACYRLGAVLDNKKIMKTDQGIDSNLWEITKISCDLNDLKL